VIRLPPLTLLWLVLPPLLWAGNAVAGRLAVGSVSPLLLNAVRWAIAALILLPLGWRILKSEGPLWSRWKRFTLLGLLGMGSYNALQYLALTTSSPINVTLIAASMPVWMLAVGALFFGERARRTQLLGAVLSLAGVLLVLSRGDWHTLMQVRLVPGDLYMVAATISWAFYSWMLARPEPGERAWPWAEFLMAQMAFGLVWAGGAAVGEWAAGAAQLEWNGWVLALLAYVAIGPSLIAYRCWGMGVAAVGPTIAAFFGNLTPVFAALMSAALLGDLPRWFHGAAFVLIAAGIVVSSRR
jgi:drug/metabolite transporter (DMT)-like permease